jgi:exodeoxyribonuclease VII large subunit
MEPSNNGVPELAVSEFVELLNQTLEVAWTGVLIHGEIANIRVSKGKWLYFDLKDELSTVKFFGTVYQLPGPLEDGMLVKVRGTPHLHQRYGFSVNVQSIQPAGEGTIRRAAELLQAQLTVEGLFAPERKRALPYPPAHIGLITSRQSAAYADFIKVIGARWSGLIIETIDVQVQGEVAPTQIVAAIHQFNASAVPPEVLVLIRGGGSVEDLAAFSTEQVTRTVAASRIPTLVAIGHEIDLSLAELAADVRASTPSNAAELLVPDRAAVRAQLAQYRLQLQHLGQQQFIIARQHLQGHGTLLTEIIERHVRDKQFRLSADRQLLAAFNPTAILQRGYAIVRHSGKTIRSGRQLEPGSTVEIELVDARAGAQITDIIHKKGTYHGN